MSSSISILLVDDSPFFAKRLAATITEKRGFSVTVVHTQDEGMELIATKQYDLVIWDIMMLKAATLYIVQMELMNTSLILLRSCETEALRWGAHDPASHHKTSVVSKPSSSALMIEFANHLEIRMQRKRAADSGHQRNAGASTSMTATSNMPPFVKSLLRQITAASPYVIGIVSSTGGPQALVEMLKSLPSDFPIPIVIVQHMSGGFMSTFSEWLDARIALPVRLASHETAIDQGVWLAPDGIHLALERERFILEDTAPVQFSKPSGDVLLKSLGTVFGSRALGIVMTGLGQDGAAGLGHLKSKGGRAYVQSPDSCTIPGMVNASLSQCVIDEALAPEMLGELLKSLVRTTVDMTDLSASK